MLPVLAFWGQASMHSRQRVHSTLRTAVLAQTSMLTGQTFVQRPQSVHVLASRSMPMNENELKRPFTAPRGQA